MKPLLVFALIAAPALALTSTLKRANNDWRFRLRLILALDLLDAHDSPRSRPVLEEVRLAQSVGRSFSDELVLVSANSVRRTPIRFHPSERLDQRAPLCEQWFEEATPLLIAIDGKGAVLHGPSGCLLGDVEQPDRRFHRDDDRDRWR